MKVVSADGASLPLPEGHRFPTDTYTRLRQRIESASELAAVVLGDGHAHRIDDTVQIHVNTVAQARRRALGSTPAHELDGHNP